MHDVQHFVAAVFGESHLPFQVYGTVTCIRGCGLRLLNYKQYRRLVFFYPALKIDGANVKELA
jgi:hypothetical protein